MSGAFCPDGTRIAVWSMYHAGLWSAADGAQDGQVALSFGRAVRLADLESGALTGADLVHPEVPGRVVFSPDGRRGAALADDWQLRFWDAATGALQESPVTVSLAENELTFLA